MFSHATSSHGMPLSYEEGISGNDTGMKARRSVADFYLRRI